MKKSILLIAILSIVFSSQVFSQKHNKYFHNHSHATHNQNLNFAGGFIAGLLLNDFFAPSINQREMYFVYNYKNNNWRLKKDVGSHFGFHFKKTTLIARFENPNGGRDFFVKINRHGRWFVDAPKKLTQILKRKVRRNL